MPLSHPSYLWLYISIPSIFQQAICKRQTKDSLTKFTSILPIDLFSHNQNLIVFKKFLCLPKGSFHFLSPPSQEEKRLNFYAKMFQKRKEFNIFLHISECPIFLDNYLLLSCFCYWMLVWKGHEWFAAFYFEG